MLHSDTVTANHLSHAVCTYNFTASLWNDPCHSRFVRWSLTRNHFGFEHNHTFAWPKLIGEHSPDISSLEEVVRVHLLSRQQLLLRVHSWPGNKVAKDMTVLDTWPCCHVSHVFVIIGRQIGVVSDWEAYTKQLLEYLCFAWATREAIYIDSCIDLNEQAAILCQPRSVTCMLKVARPLVHNEMIAHAKILYTCYACACPPVLCVHYYAHLVLKCVHDSCSWFTHNPSYNIIPGPPTPPCGLTVNTSSALSPLLSWNTSHGENTAYQLKVLQAAASGGGGVVVVNVSTTSHLFSVPQAEWCTEHRRAARYINVQGTCIFKCICNIPFWLMLWYHIS